MFIIDKFINKKCLRKSGRGNLSYLFVLLVIDKDDNIKHNKFLIYSMHIIIIIRCYGFVFKKNNFEWYLSGTIYYEYYLTHYNYGSLDSAIYIFLITNDKTVYRIIIVSPSTL